ncbi:nodulation protein NfeD [Verrucomicrobiota bacterium]
MKRFIYLLTALFCFALHSTASTVYVIPVEGMIEPALLYVIRRGVDEAVSAKADALILTMDTPGGRLDATEEIIRTLGKSKLPTYTFVEKDAFSAGAIIALSTQHIYMAPGSVIGDAMPIQVSPLGGVQAPTPDVQEKMVAAAAAIVRRAAEQGGHDTKLAEAMVRRELEYKIGDDIICPEGQLLTLTNTEAARLVGDDQRPLLSLGTVEDLDALLKTIGLEDAEVKKLEVTSAEKVARFIAAMAPLLLMIGLGGIWIEIKTPGLGAPGLIGGIALVLFFFGHHIAGLAGMEDVLIFLLGVILLFIEIFITPGFGVLGISGLLLILLALLNAMTLPEPGTPWLPVPTNFESVVPAIQKLVMALIGTGAIALIFGRMLPKSHLPIILEEEETFKNVDRETSPLIGREGLAFTTLRPSGTGAFGDERIDVVTEGEFIEKETPIRIIEVHGNRIVVEKI